MEFKEPWDFDDYDDDEIDDDEMDDFEMDELDKDAQFDAFLELLKETSKIPRVIIPNLERIKIMEKAFLGLQKLILAETPDACITYGVEELFNSDGYIQIEANEIIGRDMTAFLNCIKDASTFDIYPIKNDRVRFSIAFNGIMTEIGTAMEAE